MNPFTSCLNSVLGKCYGVTLDTTSSESLLDSGTICGQGLVSLAEFDSIASTFEAEGQPQDTILKAQTLKKLGNELFSTGQLSQAIHEYSTGIRLFEASVLPKSTSLFYETSDSKTEIGGSDLLATLFANRAAVYLRLYSFKKCLYDANLALKFKPLYEKAWARRAEALLNLRVFDQASEAYQNAASLTNDPYLYNRMAMCKIHMEHEEQGLEVHQLLPGRDICNNPSMLFAPIRSTIWEKVAIPLRNLIYLIVNKDSREAIVIDAAWDIEGIIQYAKMHKINIVAAFISHWHTDHIGGIPQAPFDKYPIRVEGISKLVKDLNIKGYCHAFDLEFIVKANPEMDSSKIIPTDTGFEFTLPIHQNSPEWQSDRNEKDTTIKVLHTPGHTAGSICFLVNGNRLFSGDTLFAGSCGRLDFHDSCKNSMFNSLQVTLAGLEDECVVFPGHLYGSDFTAIGIERIRGLLRKMDREEFSTKL